MATTPEGKVKAKVKRALEALRAKGTPIYYYMPVQNGMGQPTLDFICCLNGKFVAIETKAPGRKPTVRQEDTIKEIRDGGGAALVFDGTDVNAFVSCLLMLLK